MDCKVIYIDSSKKKHKVTCNITRKNIVLRNNIGQTVFEKILTDFYVLSSESGKERVGLFNKLYIQLLYNNAPFVKLYCKNESDIVSISSYIVKECENISNERNSIYQSAVALYKTNVLKDCEEAYRQFSSISYWLDSQEYIKKCQQKIQDLKEKAEIERKDDIYRRAVNLISKNKAKMYLSALDLLNTIKEWKDTKEKIKECEEALDIIYDEAVSLMNKSSINRLQEAIIIFDSLKDFRNAKDLGRKCYRQIDDIRAAIENERKSKIYENAIELSKEDTIASINKSLLLLKEIEDWKDVNTLAKTLKNRKSELERIAEEKRKNDIYQNAVNFVQTNTIENLEQALKLFKTVSDWKDSKEKISFCEKQIKMLKEAAFWESVELEKENCKKEVEDTKRHITKISKTTRSAVELFVHNPYCVLGLSCRASQNDALNVKDKIEKFARLKMTNAYKSVFDLKNLEKPSRDISNIQSSIVATKELSHKWLWFAKEEYACWWDSAKIFEVLEKEELGSIDYDLLLAAYIQLVVTDGKFVNFDKWQCLLNTIDKLYSLPSMQLSSILKLHVGESFASESIGVLTESFKKTFLLPFFKLCENADKEQISNLGKVLNKTFKSKELTDGLASALILNLTNRCYALESFTKEFPDKNASVEEKDKLVELAKTTENEVYENIDVLLKIVGVDSTYAKRIKKKYKDLYWDVTRKLLNNNRKTICIPFIKKIYAFCDNNDQCVLRNTYGYEQLGLSENDLSPDELNDLAIECENSGQKSRAITLFTKAAELGSSFAQSNLAFRYKNGDGVLRNVNTAIFWWKKSANSGNAIAQFALCQLYFEEGYNHNLRESMKWLRKACEQNYEPAVNFFNKIVELAKGYNYQERQLALTLLRYMGLDV